MNTVVAQRVRSTRPAAAQEKPAGGNAVNPSLEARAAPSMARTVPPAGISRTPTGRSRRASLRESVLINVAHGEGRSIRHCAKWRRAVVAAPQVEPCAHGTPDGAKSATDTQAQGVGLRPELDFRDRARQDVAPGAAMDGFAAFPEIQFRAGLHAVFLGSCSALRPAWLYQ